MSRQSHNRRLRPRPHRSVAVALVATVLTTAALVAPPTGAASSGSEGNIDKAAVVRVGVPLEDHGGVFFDPAGARSGVSASPSNRLFLDLIYDTMIHQTPDGKGAPGLATKWSAPDSSTVELTLRDGVKFSDGTSFDAAAVKAMWERTLNSGRPNLTPNVKAISSIDVADDSTLRLHLSQPLAQDLLTDDLRNSVGLGVPSPAAAAAGTDDTKPVGAGPYQFQSYETGKLVLARNPSYYDPSQQKVAGFEFTHVPFGAPSVSALQAGTVDVIWQQPPDSVKTINGTPGLKVESVPSQTMFVVNMCPTQGTFASQEARQAIAYAIDREAINQAALQGTGAPTTTVIAPSSPFYNKSLAKTYSYNPRKAKALLKEAGVAPGTTVKALVPAVAPYPVVAEVAQAQLKDVGLNVDVQQTTDIGGDLLRQTPEMAFVSISPQLYGITFGGDKSALNVCADKQTEIIAAMNEGKDTTKTVADQKASWDRFNRLVLDQSRIVPIAVMGVLAASKDEVKGLDVINSPYGPQLFGVAMAK